MNNATDLPILAFPSQHAWATWVVAAYRASVT